jgi:hypothetical protein
MALSSSGGRNGDPRMARGPTSVRRGNHRVPDQMNGSTRWLIHCSGASSQLTGVRWRRNVIQRSSRRSAGRDFSSVSPERAAHPADDLMTLTSDPGRSPFTAISPDLPAQPPSRFVLPPLTVSPYAA